jgi:uncharacterized RDD family membrane protein YckC
VKVGDFGLSISTSVRTEPSLTTSGLIMGTPAFSSPEQLRGDVITVRSDIYSVGVTLFYVLAGKTPFRAPNFVQMLATVLEKRPDSPAKWRADIPAGLSRVILRCLEKDPGQRFDSYEELRDTLLPFSSSLPTPATQGRRFLAGFIDITLIGAIAQILESGIPLKFTPFYPLLILYFGIAEGWTSKSLGKRIVGLKLISTLPRHFGFALAFARSVIFAATFFCFNLAIILFVTHRHALNGGIGGLITFVMLIVPLLLLFSTARRRNGYQGLHDIAARTRVVIASKLSRDERPATEKAGEESSDDDRIGPYHLMKRLGRTVQGEMFLGYDPRLLRKVWIYTHPDGTAPVAARLRQQARPGRLRWLTGRRSEIENWDAYEGLGGVALLDKLPEKCDWGEIRFWLLDLARELKSAANDAVSPELRLDHVWITERGQAKLLDFVAPIQTEALSQTGRANAANTFLLQIAASSLSGHFIPANELSISSISVPLPLHARSILHALQSGEPLPDIIQQLNASLTKPVKVSRARRLCLFLAMLWAPIFLTGTLLLAGHAPRIRSARELSRLQEILTTLDALPSDSEERNALETFIAGSFASTITNSWTMAQCSAAEIERQEAQAHRILEKHPRVSAEEISAAQRELEAAGVKLSGAQRSGDIREERWLWISGLACLYGIALVILPGWIAALAFGGGALLRGLGLAIVRHDGQPVSRGRALWRSVIAGLPFIIATVCLHDTEKPASAAPLCIAIVLGISSALTRGRALQDRIAGTDLVTR